MSLALDSLRARVSLLACLALLLVPLALAQEESPPDEGPPPGAEEGEGAPDQTTVYVPYKQLAEVFEKEGRGVFLPYQQFLELWKAAGKKPPVPPQAPVPFAVGSVTYKGTAGDKTATFTVEMDIETLASGWVQVPVRLAGVGIKSVQLGADAAVVTTSAGGLVVAVPEPGRHSLTVEFDTEVDARPGEKRVSFVGPRGAVTRLEMVIPEKDVLVEVEPAVAETLEPTEAGGTRVLAFVADTSKGRIDIVWEPERAEAADVVGHRFGEVSARLWVEEGLVRYQATIDYTLIQTEAKELAFSLPKSMVVLGVEGANLQDWPSQADPEDAERTRYVARLYEPAKGNFRLTLRAERSLDPGETTLAAPDLRLHDVAREKGTLGVGNVPTLALAVADSPGLIQVAPGDLPEQTRVGSTLAFRYLRHPYTLDLAVTRVEPRITAQVFTTVSLRADGVVDASVIANLNVRKAGIFEVTLGLPVGFDLREVGPDALLEDHRIVGEGEDRLLEITLAKQMQGSFSLHLALETFRPEITGDLEVPLLSVRGVEREAGVVGIAGEGSLKISTAKTEGLTPVDVRELPGSGVQQLRGTEPLLFGYRYHKRPVAATVAVERKSPKVTAALQTKVDIAGNAVRYTTTIMFMVEFSGVASFSLELPTGFQDSVAFEGDSLKSTNRQAGADGQPDVWTIETQSPRLGAWRLVASYDSNLEEVRAGQRVTFDVPIPRLRDVERQTGHIAVLKEENVEVSATPSENLEAIDTVDLPTPDGAAFLAFKYLDPAVTLELGVTRHEFEPVIPALVESMFTHSVIDEAGDGRHISVLRVRNSNEQFLQVRLPEGVKPLTVEVNGVEATLKKRDGVYLVPLSVGGPAAQSRTMEIKIPWIDRREAMSGSGSFELRPPLFEADDGREKVPVLQQHYVVHLPRGFEYYDFGPDMTEDRQIGGLWEYLRRVVSALVPHFGAQRGNQRWDRQYVAVRSGAHVSPELLARLRPFSFDRSQGGGTLTVHYSSATRFYFWFLVVFGLGLLVGKLLATKTPLRRRHVLFVLVVVPVLAGPFFSPTGAMLLGAVALAGIVLAVIWLWQKLAGKARSTRKRAAASGPAGSGPAEPVVPPPAPPADKDMEKGADGGKA